MRSISSGSQRKAHVPYSEYCSENEASLTASTARLGSALLNEPSSYSPCAEKSMQEISVERLNSEEFSQLTKLLDLIFQGKAQSTVHSDNSEIEFFLQYEHLYHSRNQQVTSQFLDFVSSQNLEKPLSKREKKSCQEAFLITTHPRSYLGSLDLKEKKLLQEAQKYCEHLYALVNAFSKEASSSQPQLLEKFKVQQKRYLSIYQNYRLTEKDKQLQHQISLYLKLKEILLSEQPSSTEFKALTHTLEMIKDNIQNQGGKSSLEEALRKKEQQLTEKALSKQKTAFQFHHYLLKGEITDDNTHTPSLRGEVQEIYRKKFKEKPLSAAFFYTFLYSNYNRLSSIPRSKIYSQKLKENALSYLSRKKQRSIDHSEVIKELKRLLDEIKIYDHESSEDYKKCQKQVSEGRFSEVAMVMFDRIEVLKKRREIENTRLLFPFIREVEIQKERTNFNTLYSLNTLPNFESWIKNHPLKAEEWPHIHAKNGGEYLQRKLFLHYLSAPTHPSLLSLPETMQLDYPLLKEIHKKSLFLKQKLQLNFLLEQYVKKLSSDEMSRVARELESLQISFNDYESPEAMKEVLLHFSRKHKKTIPEQVFKQLENPQSLVNQAFDKLMYEQFEYYLKEGRSCHRVEKHHSSYLKEFQSLCEELNELYSFHQKIHKENYQFLAEKLLFERALEEITGSSFADSPLPSHLEKVEKLFYPLEKKWEKTSFLHAAFIHTQESKKQRQYLEKKAKIEKVLNSFTPSQSSYQNLSQYLKEFLEFLKKALKSLKLPLKQNVDKVLDRNLQQVAMQLSAQKLLDASVFSHLKQSPPSQIDYKHHTTQEFYQCTLHTLIGKNLAFESASMPVNKTHSQMLIVKNAKGHTLLDIAQRPEYNLKELENFFIKAHQKCFKNPQESQRLKQLFEGKSLHPLIAVQKKQLKKEMLNRHQSLQSPSIFGTKNNLKVLLDQLYQDCENLFVKIKQTADAQHALTSKPSLPDLKTGENRLR